MPLRLLGVGLPLTIALGAVLAAVIFDQLNATEAIVLAILLAATDAALGEAVVTDPRLPSRLRQGFNVESGLNDGICVRLLLIALAAADVEDKAASGSHAIRIVAEQIGDGILGGVAAGLAAAAVVVAIAYRRNLISGSWLQVIPVAGAGLAYGIAVALGGSGFIAAFLAGAIFGALVSRKSEQASRLNEELGGLLGGVTFLIFGAVLLGPALKHVNWQIAIYAVLSLTLVRMLPVAVAMIGTGAGTPTVGFLGWFGPRGLASAVFAVIVVEEAHLPAAETILATTYVTIGLSVIAHGITAAPLARRYAQLARASTCTATKPTESCGTAPTPNPDGSVVKVSRLLRERGRGRGCESLLRSPRQAGIAQRCAIGTLLGEEAAFSSGTDRVVLTTEAIDEAVSVRRASVLWLLVVVAVTAIAVFVALTIAVTGSSSLALDSRAFEIADDVRAPWLDAAARVITELGLIAIVGSAVLVGAAVQIKHHDRARAGAVLVGAALVWISVRIVKSVVNRPRPPEPLVHTSGQSYPSAHAANSVGWLALAIALTVVIPTRAGQIAAITAGALLAVFVGLSRIYLRAHYASDVLAGEALAVAMYVLATIAAVAWQSRRAPAIGGSDRRLLP